MPAPPSVPARPWVIVLASGAVCLVALLALVWLAKDDPSDVPPAWVFAASGIVVAGVGSVAVWLACTQSRLVPRTAIALGAAFVCIALAKFTLAPFGFFDRTRDRTIELIVSQQTLIVVAGAGVLALYVVAILVIRRVARGRLVDSPKIRTSAVVGVVVGMVAVAFAIPIATVVVAGPAYYLSLVFTSVVGIGLILALMAATALVTGAFLSAEDRAHVLARASMLATVTWIALAFVVLFHVLWIVFMLALVAVWPLRTVTPK